MMDGGGLSLKGSSEKEACHRQAKPRTKDVNNDQNNKLKWPMKIRKSEKPKSARQLCNGEMKRFAC